jgi:hypothetical protein
MLPQIIPREYPLTITGADCGLCNLPEAMANVSRVPVLETEPRSSSL